MNLRPYQQEAIDAVNAALMERDDNPLVVIPTAGGKTIVFATLVQQWLAAWPATRVCILAHVKELLTQAEDKIKRVWPAAPVGVWSAGLKRRQGSMPITIAGIQSIYKRAYDFDPFDAIIVDEAHLIPVEGEGMYRSFIDCARKANPNVRVIGFTATPFRLDGGHIAQKDYILNHVCYEAEITRLIGEGYICKLTSKATDTKLSGDGVRIRQGDYAQKELEKKVNTDSLVEAACAEMVKKGADRKSWLIFCCGVEHACNVARCLQNVHGITTEVVTGDTDADVRRQTLEWFDAGHIRAVVNVNCLTTGLDVTRIDLIAMLRPTQSTSLYVQMVGRGFRLHADKGNCLILDFGENVLRHGPVDAIMVNDPQRGDGEGVATSKVCPNCREIVPAGVLVCPMCEFAFPPREIEHQKHAHEVPIISESEPWTMDVEMCSAELHQKSDDRPPVLKVSYYHGMQRHTEWVCLEHPGYAGHKARDWWRRRFPGEEPPKTVAEALSRDIFLAATLARMTSSIKVKQVGKYTDVIETHLRTGKTALMGR
jgi:DNA repair protein RadD